ncbi:MAG: NAD-binding protein [Proteobacteria bacterium]|nr:NAD-binding protein [Pseudomonadota bacterium]MDA1327002.1 NAD-binding protein [Pseudomonadota bacterium]
MRIVIIGGSSVAEATTKLLLNDHHDVVIIERDKTRIESLSESLDCGFIHGDGSTPAILREAAPGGTDLLLCLTNHDQDNILASLVARSLGFQRIVTKIEDPEFEHVCVELGLSDTIIPDLNTARTLADVATGTTAAGLSAAIRGEIRFFSFVARDEDEGTVEAVDLPKEARIILIYRGENIVFAEPDTKILPKDEVVILTHSKNLPKLQERWTVP